jgi:hypothetical protein
MEPRGALDLSLWLDTDKVDDLYRLLRARQLKATRLALPLSRTLCRSCLSRTSTIRSTAAGSSASAT